MARMRESDLCMRNKKKLRIDIMTVGQGQKNKYVNKIKSIIRIKRKNVKGREIEMESKVSKKTTVHF